MPEAWTAICPPPSGRLTRRRQEGDGREGGAADAERVGDLVDVLRGGDGGPGRGDPGRGQLAGPPGAFALGCDDAGVGGPFAVFNLSESVGEAASLIVVVSEAAGGLRVFGFVGSC